MTTEANKETRHAQHRRLYLDVNRTFWVGALAALSRLLARLCAEMPLYILTVRSVRFPKHSLQVGTMLHVNIDQLTTDVTDKNTRDGSFYPFAFLSLLMCVYHNLAPSKTITRKELQYLK